MNGPNQNICDYKLTLDLYTNDFKVLVLADFVFYRKKKFKLTVNKKKR